MNWRIRRSREKAGGLLRIISWNKSLKVTMERSKGRKWRDLLRQIWSIKDKWLNRYQGWTCLMRSSFKRKRESTMTMRTSQCFWSHRHKKGKLLACWWALKILKISKIKTLLNNKKLNRWRIMNSRLQKKTNLNHGLK